MITSHLFTRGHGECKNQLNSLQHSITDNGKKLEQVPLMCRRGWSLRIKVQHRLPAPSLSETFTGSAIFSLHGPSLLFIIDTCFSLIDHSASEILC